VNANSECHDHENISPTSNGCVPAHPDHLFRPSRDVDCEQWTQTPDHGPVELSYGRWFLVEG